MAQAQVRDVPRTTPAPGPAPQPSPLAAPAGDPAPPRTPPTFRDVLRHRYCSRLLVSSVTGRLSLGMVPVALILAAQADGHSLATASLLAALYGIAPALGLPLLGRLADLRGLPLPCHTGAALVAAALGTLALTGTSHLPLTAICVALAGAGCPPLEGGLRSLWHAVLPDDAHVRTAYTLDSSTQQIVYVTGPALSIAIATWLSPAAALALAAAVTLAGSLAFATARPARTWRAAPRRPDRRGVLRPPAMRPLLISLVFLGATIGALDVAGIAVAERQDASWFAGALPAAFSAAGLLGGVLYARFQPATAPRSRHLMLLGAAFTAGWLPLLAPLPAPAILVLAMLPGALFVPLLTVASLTLTSVAPPGTSTETVGWMSSAIRLGLAGGTALAGPLDGHFAVPLMAAALCALLLSARPAPAPAATAV
ncbi:MFS transporter [Streptomyces sp. NBC_01433]|uniref:MFS transporter n=1 Tax=Streptomyces sp. NBC_01433 TaxID=2903864 RepID=UPI00224E128B|nr:MFS transporter [Streptomyces sp. NBC_01433]MCX4681344.1 MFS transporter [Streptomyces sp. NBC_01433]MCX4681718.1 MFS transporter [Streptomyces sp. NBC_01433]MCX4682420.1 MFS transporter [Streptomyces sp. NBC_01433]